MPEMNGIELYRRLRIIDNKVKVFFLASGRVNYAMVRKELSPESKSNYIIRKPIENEDLIELRNSRGNQVIAEEEDDEDEENAELEAILYTLFTGR